MTLTRYGIREWGLALLATILILAGCWYLVYRLCYVRTGIIIGAAALVIFLAFAAFFRNPRRRIPANPLLLISPADGTVKDIVEVDDFNLPPFTGKAIRVGIFLSVLSVHVNRASADLDVENVSYREGEFLDARDENAIQKNEAMTISGTANATATVSPWRSGRFPERSPAGSSVRSSPAPS